MYVFYDIYYFYLTNCIIKTLEKGNRNMIHKKYFTHSSDKKLKLLSVIQMQSHKAIFYIFFVGL